MVQPDPQAVEDHLEDCVKSKPTAVSQRRPDCESTYLAAQWVPSTFAACAMAITRACASLSRIAAATSRVSTFSSRTALERRSSRAPVLKVKSSITAKQRDCSQCSTSRSARTR